MALYRLADTKETIFPILWLCWHYMPCSSYVLIWDDTRVITPPYCLFSTPSSLKAHHFPNISRLERSHVVFKEILYIKSQTGKDCWSVHVSQDQDFGVYHRGHKCCKYPKLILIYSTILRTANRNLKRTKSINDSQQVSLKIKYEAK